MLLNGPLSHANNSLTESQILKSPRRGGVFQRSPLTVTNNGAVKISCCFFGDILNFCSPLAYISIHYHSISRQVIKTRIKICFGATFRLDLSAVMMKRQNQNNFEHNEGTVCHLSFLVIPFLSNFLFLLSLTTSFISYFSCHALPFYFSSIPNPLPPALFISCHSFYFSPPLISYSLLVFLSLLFLLPSYLPFPLLFSSFLFPSNLISCRYPFTISKSNMYSVGSPHTWPMILGALCWLIELIRVSYQSSWTSSGADRVHI